MTSNSPIIAGELYPAYDLYPGGCVAQLRKRMPERLRDPVISTCSHRHRNGATALACARRMLRQNKKNA